MKSKIVNMMAAGVEEMRFEMRDRCSTFNSVLRTMDKTMVTLNQKLKKKRNLTYNFFSEVKMLSIIGHGKLIFKNTTFTKVLNFYFISNLLYQSYI